MNQLLTVQEAYKMMLRFLEQQYTMTKSDDLGALLGAMQLLEDDVSADPAMWEDWKKCMMKVNRGDGEISLV